MPTLADSFLVDVDEVSNSEAMEEEDGESRIKYLAPNLSAIVGSAVAAKLVAIAGGLSNLAYMPAYTVQLLGADDLAGLSTAASQFRAGYLQQTEIFQGTTPCSRMRACRLLASKSALAARVDSIGRDPSGNTGHNLREEICKKIANWKELLP